MQVDYLIIGQGISGTFLSWYLQKMKKSFIVIDNNDQTSASRVAAGIINPVTGRRIVKTWMIDELLPFVWDSYTQMGNELNSQVISQKNIIEFFPSLQIKNAFNDRLIEDDQYLKSGSDSEKYFQKFNYDFGYGEIDPCYMIHLDTLLPLWRQNLVNENCLLNEDFDGNLVFGNDRVSYRNITAQKIIFCDGINSMQQSLFKNLPFSQVKGEVLIIESGELPDTNIFKKGMILAPMSEPGHFWVGSNYLWEFDNNQPTDSFRIKTEQALNEWLKIPFRIVDHKASIRPATLERRPFVGVHPQNEKVCILNGMGTKGCSLAPFFAKQLAEHLAYGNPVMPEADINRFRKIISRD
jgi:glycine/D-amino acid oxidase-like deaminating enzyme